MGNMDLSWNETLHPRDDHGRWVTAAGLLKSHGGFTMDLNGNEIKSGWSVGIPTTGKRDGATITGEVKPTHINDFVNTNTEEFRNPKRALGGWKDENGNGVLDVVEIHHNERKVAHLALTGKQHSVYNTGTGEEVRTQDMVQRALSNQPAEQTIQYGDRLVTKHERKDSKGKVKSVTYHVSAKADPTDKGSDYTDPEALAQHIAFRHGVSRNGLDARKLTKKVDRRKNPYTGADYSHDTLTPSFGGEYDFAKNEDGKLAFWKQILPKKTVHYTAKDGSRQVIDFNEQYLTDLANNKALDKVGFLLADKNNAHTMDPDRWRGEVAQMEVREDGLYGKIVFPSPEAAQAVLANPDLGVSARIREGVAKSDGSVVPRGIIHVLGTLDPQISGMSPWQVADLSAEQDDVLDLSNAAYEETIVATDKPLSEYTEADINAMTDEELDAFLSAHVPEFDQYTSDQTKDKADTSELVGAGADMSDQTPSDIELANAAVAQANARAEEAMRRVAEAEWREERAAFLGAGVPPHALDLAAPVLNRPDDMVIDLSVTDEADVNVSEVVRGLLDAMKGTVDLSNEQGHNGTFSANDGEDPDAPLLAQWVKQS